MKKATQILLYVLLCFTISLKGIEQKDSLYIHLKKADSGKKKVILISKALRKAKNNTVKFNALLKVLDSLQNSFQSKSDKAFALLEISKIYKYKHDEQQALAFAFKSLNEYEIIQLDSGIMEAHHEIALSLRETKNYLSAIPHLYKSLFLAHKINNLELKGDNHSVLGATFKDLKNIDSSLFHHRYALNYRLEFGNKSYIAATYNDIGLAYRKKQDYQMAIDYLKKALEMRENQKDMRGVSGACINIGNTLKNMKLHKEAAVYYNRGIDIAKKFGYSDFFLNGLSGRAENAIKLKDYKSAALDYDYYVEKKDSIYKVNLNSQIAEMDVKYQSDKKDAELKLQEEQLLHKSEQNTKQKTISTLALTALIIALIAVAVVFRSYRINKKNARELASKNQLIEEKNKEITDSINYAKHIQQSLLASKDMLDKHLDSYFIFYKPKDIVSGDFYWAEETPDGFLIAAVDCTGHGVPGAFMSLIGKENLDKAVTKTTNPGELLNELNKGVKRSLNQNSETSSRDGMDAVIVKLKKDYEGNTQITYAGANRPLYIINSGSNILTEVKPTKQAIGGLTKIEQTYSEHIVNVNKGDTLFLTTDGYADQFGSDKNKKLTTKRFKELLISISSSPSSNQKESLVSFFKKWKGNHEQLDDLLIIGIKI